MQQKKQSSQPLSQRLSDFINVSRTLKTLMSLLASEELTSEEREDIAIMAMYLIDEHLQPA
jgi:hypothetical protein